MSIRFLKRMQATCLLAFIVFISAVSAAMASTEVQEIIVLHTNDLHGHLLPVVVDGETRGGLARLASVVRTYRDHYPGRVIWLDAGDAWHGSNLAGFSSGQSVVDVLNIAGLDVMVLGNHEFNYNQDVLLNRVSEAAFAVLAGNVVVTETGETFLPATTLINVGDVTVGILGLVSPETPILSHPQNSEGLEFHDPITVARSLAAQLAKEANLVIAVTHVGLEYDRILAAAVPEIDLIVSGHSHTQLDEPEVVDGTLIVQAFEWGKYLGVLHLVVDAEGIVEYNGYLVPITDEISEELAVTAAIAEWQARLDARLSAVIGETLVELDAAGVRVQESNLGNWMADLMREYVGADVAFINSGAIRRSIAAGPITLGDIYEVHPFNNTIIGLELTGKQILAALENSVLHYPDASGRFLQVSGLSYTFDPNKPPGERVVSVRIHSTAAHPDGEPLRLDEVYRVAIPDFIAVGGDDYDMFAGSPVFFGSPTEGGAYLLDILVSAVELASPIKPEVEGRIQMITD